MNKTDLKKIKAYHIAPNHIEIETPKGVILQSYNSVIAIKQDGKITLGSHWDYSRTTVKYLGQWLGMDSKEIRARIADKRIKYDDNLI